MSYVRTGRVDKAVETSTPAVLFIILAIFTFVISPIILLIELYFQNKLLKIRHKKDIIWALNSTYSFWILILGLFVICLFDLFNKYRSTIIPLIVLILLLIPHIVLSIKYKSKFNRFARLKAIKRKIKVQKEADMILRQQKEEDRIKREINKMSC